jgi:hypothetical protein
MTAAAAKIVCYGFEPLMDECQLSAPAPRKQSAG